MKFLLMISLLLSAQVTLVSAQETVEALQKKMEQKSTALQDAYKKQRELRGMQGDIADNVNALVDQRLKDWQAAKKAYDDALKPVPIETLKQIKDQKNKELQDIYKKMDEVQKYGDFDRYESLNTRSKTKLAEFRLAEKNYNDALKTASAKSTSVSGPPIPKLSAEEKNYKPETCVWSTDIPKRLVFGPGCKNSNSRICVGYVICDQKDPEGKFVRMSTCSEKNCVEGNEAAVACTKENGYGSRKPSEDASISLGTSVQSIMLKTETVAE